MADPLQLEGWRWKITHTTLGLSGLVGADGTSGEGSVVIKEIMYSMKLNYGKGLYKKIVRES